MNKENTLEYNGKWHKNKDGKCESFTMKDLEELLQEAYKKGYTDRGMEEVKYNQNLKKL